MALRFLEALKLHSGLPFAKMYQEDVGGRWTGNKYHSSVHVDESGTLQKNRT